MRSIRERAQDSKARVLFPEGQDRRVQEAAVRLSGEGLAEPILLGDPSLIELGAGGAIEVIDPNQVDLLPLVANFRATRQGVDEETARRIFKSPLILGSMMVADGRADALVAGASSSMQELISAAELGIGYGEGVSAASSYSLVEWHDGVLVFTDAAVMVEPSAEELAEIAVLAACQLGVLLGVEPRIAFLAAFARGALEASPWAALIRDAVRSARELAPGLAIDGPLSVSVALADGGAVSVLPDSPLCEAANVLVFPHLDAAHCGLKLMECLAGVYAIGPVLQGFAKPVGYLPSAASVEEIVDKATIAAVLM